MNHPQETNRSLPPQEGLESPFLNEALFHSEGQDEWEAGLARLEAESPFLSAYLPGAVPAETETDVFGPKDLSAGEAQEEEGLAEQHDPQDHLNLLELEGLVDWQSLVDLEAEASSLYQQDLLYPEAEEVEEEEDPSLAEILEEEEEENLVLEEAEQDDFENNEAESETAPSPFAEIGIESEEEEREEDLADFEDLGTLVAEELLPAAGYEIEAEEEDLFGDAGEAVEEEQELDPSLGKTYYLPVQLNKSLPPKVGVFIPGSVKTASARDGVDLIIYFHGHMIRDCEKNPEKFDRDGIEHYWNTPLFICLREELARSGLPAILIAPTLHPFLARSEAGYGNLNQAGKFDFLINETMKGLAAQGALPADAQVRRIILSGHSGGGLPMQKILSAKNAFNKQVVECWGFECLYFGLGDWTRWLNANPGQHFLHFRRQSFKQDESKALARFSNFRDTANAGGHCTILKEKWRAALDSSPAFHGGKALVPAAASGATSGIFAFLSGLPGLAALPLVFMTALLKGIRDENQLTNLIFFTRHPELGGRKLTAGDPKSLKDEWVSILKNSVRPALQRIQAGSPTSPVPAAPSLPAPSASGFPLTGLKLESKKIVIARAGDKKKGTEVLIEEAPAIFLPRIVAMARDRALKDKKPDLAARLDPLAWFKQFTRITFLGRELRKGQYVHLELAQRLKAIEAQMVQTLGGDPKSVGDLLLKNSQESIAGSRLVSSTATFSMHMFGLAVDVNYLGNPYIQNRAIPTLNRVLSSAAGLLNLPVPVYQPGRGFDSIQNLDNLLERYFALLDSPAELDQLAAKSQAAEWRGLSSAAAREKVQKHLDGLAPLLARGDYKTYFKQHAILNFDKRFVTQMEALGMHWGGEYGDMMHFDLRQAGVGYYIHKARLQYSQQARDQARRFYNQKSYGTHPAGEAEIEGAEEGLFLQEEAWLAPAFEGQVATQSGPTAAIRSLQNSLNQWRTENNQPPIGVDGVNGKNTRQAVAEFQKGIGIKKVDGIAGPVTRELLALLLGILSAIPTTPLFITDRRRIIDLANSAGFRSLDDTRKITTLQQIVQYQRAPATADQTRLLAELILQNGFESVHPIGQARLLDLLAGRPGDADLSGQLQSIASSSVFRSFSKAKQTWVLQRLTGFPGNHPRYRNLVNLLSTILIFSAITNESRDLMLKAYVSQPNNTRIIDDFQKLTGRPDFNPLPQLIQNDLIQRVINHTKGAQNIDNMLDLVVTPGFQNLTPSVQWLVLDGLPTRYNGVRLDPLKISNIMTIIATPGFEKLLPEAMNTMLNYMANRPDNTQLASNFSNLVQDPKFHHDRRMSAKRMMDTDAQTP